ncbi:GTPase IMAP family member 4-like isoform X1 [Sinocyclocheilus anshuiensis]|uniref:GTPase IMAP family member 4-like isoform X1 n=2 Tax=Sinocyclocheilus anshuiensis TaxID=1608454 RepID=UPI0007B9F61F|nr:PREDICTED: GTPase IMAP family member 4-like isoform X1 [Sinocyclocheilus anshuiensis]
MAVSTETSYVNPEGGSLMGLVLLGRRHAGKSSLGDLILGRREFEPGKKTTRCVRRFGWVDGVRLAVVDTPGWSLFGLADARLVKQEILHSVMLAPPGQYLIFLLVIPVDSFSKRDGRAMEKYLGILGDMVWSHTLVLFTWGDELRGSTIEKHIQENGEPLQEILRKCGHRYHVVNNKCPEDFNQVTELLNILKQMCARTG